MGSWIYKVCLVVVLGVPAQVRAESPKEQMKKAEQLHGLADFEGSLKVLDQAIQSAKEPGLLGKIHMYRGLNHGELDQLDKARAAFTSALTHDPDRCPDPAQFKAHLAKLCREVRAGMKGKLSVTASRPGATVELDGQVVGRTPLQTDVEVGTHVVLVRSEGETQERKVKVFVDKPGSVMVELKQADTPVPTPVQPRPGRKRLWTWIAAGAAVAALAVATGVWLAADSQYDDWKETPDSDASRLEELESSIKGKEKASWAMFGVAGALAVTSAVLFFLEGRPAQERRSVSFSAGGNQVGLGFEF